MTTDFDAGVLLPSAVWSSGTSTLVSGKYAAAHPRAVGNAIARDPGARRSSVLPSRPVHSLFRAKPPGLLARRVSNPYRPPVAAVRTARFCRSRTV